MTKPILCVGRLYCDLVFANAPRLPTLGTEVFAPALSLHTGGGGFITGATLASLGHSVAQFSYLPAAPFDTIALADLVKSGIDATNCKPAAEGVDPQITVAIAMADDRAFLTRAAGPAVPDLETIAFSDFNHLHIGELSTLQDTPALLDHARAAGLTVSLDCGWQDTFDMSAAGVIAAVDVFLPNESEAAALAEIGVPETCASLTVVKCGEQGARARSKHDGNWTHCDVEQRINVVDPTGAGDAFNAGFLSCWLKQASLEDCLRQGNACGAAKVQVIGGVDMPACG